jgi:hypothetical protein
MKKIAILTILCMLLLLPVALGAWEHNSCAYKRTITVTNNDAMYDMVEHDVNISIDTTGYKWNTYPGEIYVVETTGTANNRKWWNETSFNNANTIIWTKLNVSAGGTGTFDIYYSCSDSPTTYSGKETLTLYDDFNDGTLDSNVWSQITSDVACDYTEANGRLLIDADNVGENDFCGISTKDAYLLDANSSYLIQYAFKTQQTQLKFLLDNNSQAVFSTDYPYMLAIYHDGRTENAQYSFRTRDGGDGSFENTLEYHKMYEGPWYNNTFFVNQSIFLHYNLSSPTAVNTELLREVIDLSWWLTNRSYVKFFVYDLTDTQSEIDDLRVIKYFADGNAFTYSIGSEKLGSMASYLVYERIFDSTVFEATTAGYGVNLTYNTSTFDLISMNLIYNNSYTTMNKIHDDNAGNVIFNVSQTTPTIILNTDFDFWYEVVLTNSIGSFYFNDTTQTQTVQYNYFSNCTETNSTDAVTLNFTIKDELDRDFVIFNSTIDITLRVGGDVNSMHDNITFEAVNVSNYAVCIPQGKTFYTDAMIEYYAGGYDIRQYYLNKAPLTNTTQNIDLYLLEINLATGTLLSITDEVYTPLQDVYANIQRYDVGTDTYYTVAMTKSDDNGEDYVYLRHNDAWYKFVLYNEDGEVIFTSSPKKVTTNELVFRVISSTIDRLYAYLDRITYSFIFNNATKTFTLTATDTTGSVNDLCLRVIRRETNKDTFVCDQCETSSSATINCAIGADATGLYTATFYATANDVTKNIAQLIYENYVDKLYQKIGQEGIFSAFMLTGTMGFVGIVIAGAAGGIVMTIIAVILSVVMGLIELSFGALIALIIVGVIVVWKLRH